jgi:MSHA biogenesis protein MshO
MTTLRKQPASGFSMIELIAALAVTGVLAAGLTLWMSRPLEALRESHGRAAALDQASRVAAMLQRELPEALPNSVRIACAGRCLEFIPAIAYGDYRTAAPGDVLQFGAADDRFDVLKPLGVVPQPGMQVVVNNQNALPAGSGSAYSNAGNNNRTAVVAGASAAQVRMNAKQFPAPSPSQRFFLITTPVSYLCAPQASGGALRRRANYAIQSAQPVNTTQGDLLGGDITDCAFNLDPSGLVTLRLAVASDAGDPVSYMAQVRLPHRP